MEALSNRLAALDAEVEKRLQDRLKMRQKRMDETDEGKRSEMDKEIREIISDMERLNGWRADLQEYMRTFPGTHPLAITKQTFARSLGCLMCHGSLAVHQK